MTDLDGKLVALIKTRKRRVVVVGDVMVDRWLHGSLAVCQDGCQKFVLDGVVETPGGAANAENCLRNWTVRTSLYGFDLKDCPIKSRYVVDGRIVWRADDDGPKTRGVGYEWARRLCLESINLSDSVGAVLLCDYDKGFLTPEFIQQVVGACRRRGIPCVVDAKRAPELYEGCILKCNADYQHRHNDSLSRLVYDAEVGQQLVVTTGPSNPLIWDRTLPPQGLGYSLLPVPCLNHVGAGDCFAAHLTLALTYGLSLKEAAALAHSAGRVYVQHQHNRAPYPSEVAVDLASASTSTP